MKTVIYNIFKLGYDGIAFAVCCGFIASFFIPIKGFLLFTVFVVFTDTITGILAARKRGEQITSKGLYRTSQKCLVYLCGIMIFEGARLTFQLPFNITYMVAFTIATTELFSIAENIKSITGVNIGVLVLRF
ncbi:MAG: hypothetical protein EBR82_76950, partial [Caulobacteraceae bacterium]|nr:hypothetical protein [Caulobacteraceae bacterium]